MLNVTVQTVRKTATLRCRGRIVAGDEAWLLRQAVLAQADKIAVIIDLSLVDAIDAGGLGLLLELLAWASSRRMHLRLVHATRRVQQVVEATHLIHILDFDFFEPTRVRPHDDATGAAA
jgi:anti-anti-sigma factor